MSRNQKVTDLQILWAIKNILAENNYHYGPHSLEQIGEVVCLPDSPMKKGALSPRINSLVERGYLTAEYTDGGYLRSYTLQLTYKANDYMKNEQR